MAATIKENNEKSLFEIKASFDDKNIFQRKVKENGKTKNQVKRIVNSLPTATVHLFSEKEFERLKAIEQDLNEQIKVLEEKKSISSLFFRFLEI